MARGVQNSPAWEHFAEDCVLVKILNIRVTPLRRKYPTFELVLQPHSLREVSQGGCCPAASSPVATCMTPTILVHRHSKLGWSGERQAVVVYSCKNLFVRDAERGSGISREINLGTPKHSPHGWSRHVGYDHALHRSNEYLFYVWILPTTGFAYHQDSYISASSLSLAASASRILCASW